MKRSSSSTNQAVRLIKLIYHTSDSMAEALSDVLAELELNDSQASMLWTLDPDSAPMAMREIARRMHCDPSNITLIADRLVDAGLVERQPHPTDGRRRVLALTSRGLKVRTILIDRILERSPIFKLSEAEQARLSTLLSKAEASTALLHT